MSENPPPPDSVSPAEPSTPHARPAPQTPPIAPAAGSPSSPAVSSVAASLGSSLPAAGGLGTTPGPAASSAPALNQNVGSSLSPAVVGAAKPKAVKAAVVRVPGTGPHAKGGSATPGNRVFESKTSSRDIIVAVVIGLVVLALVGIGISALSKVPGKPSTNMLTGTIVEKIDTGIREREITFSKKGLKGMETESGYVFKVQTQPDGRIYEVPVPKVQYTKYEVGQKYDFIRPVSEQH